jgi:hypothetical protein
MLAQVRTLKGRESHPAHLKIYREPLERVLRRFSVRPGWPTISPERSHARRFFAGRAVFGGGPTHTLMG